MNIRVDIAHGVNRSHIVFQLPFFDIDIPKEGIVFGRKGIKIEIRIPMTDDCGSLRNGKTEHEEAFVLQKILHIPLFLSREIYSDEPLMDRYIWILLGPFLGQLPKIIILLGIFERDV